MGKKGSKKDRSYITASEWRDEGGGHKGRLQNALNPDFKRLPFHCCAISFQPFEDPVCTPDGIIMDIINAVPYINKFHKNPATGDPLHLKDLARLHFHRNPDNEYHCPVLNKVFNEHTHIVAIKTSGNVYCWEAIDELCLKAKNLRDLISDEPFTRRDIIHIQDPLNLSGRNLAQFDHVKHNKQIRGFTDTKQEQEEHGGGGGGGLQGINTNAVSQDTKRVLDALGSTEAANAFASGGGGKKAQAERALAEAKAAAAKTTTTTATADPRLRSEPRSRDPMTLVTFKPGTHTWNTDAVPVPSKKINDDVNGGKKVPPPYSTTYTTDITTTGAASKAFTSTAMPVATKNEAEMRRVQLMPRKKGYVRLHTTLGDVNIELHCDLVPITCENFMALAAGGYYTNTVFHRSIKNFMVQGGDPTGTGKGGSSVFGAAFEDEIALPTLSHDGRGVVAMANSGRNSNGSQFYILYKSAPHLNGKHSVFGKVVGGFEVLSAMERVATDEEDRPVQQIKITGVTVFVNPYVEMIEEEEERKRKRKKMEEEESGRQERMPFFAMGVGTGAGAGTGGVGKYLQQQQQQQQQQQHGSMMRRADGDDENTAKTNKKAKTIRSGNDLANFDAW